MKTDIKILTGTFFFVFCVSLALNIFYLTGCNEIQVEGVPAATEADTEPVLDLASPDMRYDELIRHYVRAGRIARKSYSYDTEINAIGQQVQIISILEMRDYYPVDLPSIEE